MSNTLEAGIRLCINCNKKEHHYKQDSQCKICRGKYKKKFIAEHKEHYLAQHREYRKRSPAWRICGRCELFAEHSKMTTICKLCKKIALRKIYRVKREARLAYAKEYAKTHREAKNACNQKYKRRLAEYGCFPIRIIDNAADKFFISKKLKGEYGEFAKAVTLLRKITKTIRKKKDIIK